MTTSALEPLILLDTHVHLHQCFDVGQVLSKAAENFSARAAQLGCAENFLAFLCLTEMAGENWFSRQFEAVHQQSKPISIDRNWSLKPTSEPFSLLAVHPNGIELVLFAGRQIVTQERLEVLALLTDKTFPDGQPLTQTVHAIATEKGIPVLPWGVGKWIGKRGKLVADFLQANDAPKVFLGDNSGRPLGWRRPVQFSVAEQKGIPILPGTDPLPLPSEGSRVGSFGLQLSGSVDQDRPAASVMSRLQSLSPPSLTYGNLETPWRFIKNQIALRA
ncbi:hypothetical protein PN498_11350 [Oscillatoria sp. CS-180]|uniref:hypothetical protein n=1 Tax=Oscillatoria sp. CS-180 TaxID=3021720 RepID=UPI00232FCCC6|nr:hypothetical protein [Oscillatoria sp. CS-180]MDB9526588.1 hypothetical protein [Oscillatoria sp. CS-180]